MTSLRNLVAQALASADSDAELARTLVSTGALVEIVRRGTYGDVEVKNKLTYSSTHVLRAAVSKARRGKGGVPTPILEGRRWSRAEVDHYRRTRSRTASTTTDTSPTTYTSSTSTTSIDATADNSVDASSTSVTTSGSLSSGTGDAVFVDSGRHSPDQWRK